MRWLVAMLSLTVICPRESPLYNEAGSILGCPPRRVRSPPSEAHDQRSRPRAAGSMDTTIADFAKFLAGFARGDGLSATSRAEMVKAQMPITKPSQFPTFATATSPAMQATKLSAGLGVITFVGPMGPGFFKGGHNDITGNQAICVEKKRRCVLFLSNDVRAEGIFQRLAEARLGDLGMPWSWEGYTPYDQAPAVSK